MAAAGSTGAYGHLGAVPAEMAELSCGRYRLQTLLGEGSAAQVFQAHDPLLDRPVALKVLRPGLDGGLRDAFLRRFRVELKVFGRVAHPHVVGVYDANLEGERPWLVMELCSGPTLSDWLTQQGPCSPGQAAMIFHQAALALDHIHALGIVHRDVKLANLLFHHRVLKLTDFGVAQAVFITEPPDGRMVGTPGYMPPEQHAGDRAGPRADLFSLAAVLYELLSGVRPLGNDASSLLYDREYDAILPITRLAPDLMPDFDEFFEQALARDPAKRFGSGAELVAALARIVPEHELEGIAGIKAVSPGASVAPSLYGYSQAGRVANVYQAQRALREPPPPPSQDARRKGGAIVPPWVKAGPKLEKAREVFEMLHFEEDKPSPGVQTLNALKTAQKEKRRTLPPQGLPFADHGLHQEVFSGGEGAPESAPRPARKAKSAHTLQPGTQEGTASGQAVSTQTSRVITPESASGDERRGLRSSGLHTAVPRPEGSEAAPAPKSSAMADAPRDTSSEPEDAPGSASVAARRVPHTDRSLLILAAVIGVLLTLAFFAGTRVGEQRARSTQTQPAGSR